MYKTDHKKLLIDIFSTNKEKSFTAVKLANELEGKMNKATVYRQLKSLEEEKILRKTYNAELDLYEYQYSDSCSKHFHLKCVSCGKIIHLKCHDADHFISHIYEHHGFKIDQYSSTINGLCEDCSK